MTRGVRGIFAGLVGSLRKKQKKPTSRAMPSKMNSSAAAERRPITFEPTANGRKVKKLKEALLWCVVFGSVMLIFFANLKNRFRRFH
jgi:hypothetical protein